jgi:UDP-N-acetylglucosamine/UDP-N-acetylgalactosamine diphosphorylase
VLAAKKFSPNIFLRCVAELNAKDEKLDDRMEPLPPGICGSMSSLTSKDKVNYERSAFEAIIDGKMAVLLLAGGQGTRLGVPYPKGMYNVGLPSGKTLFQLQAERLLRLQNLAEAEIGRPVKSGIPWYIMTSASTIKPTEEFFKKNSYFGLDKKNVILFQQGTLPCFAFTGKQLNFKQFCCCC